jgi:hypothetical protein
MTEKILNHENENKEYETIKNHMIKLISEKDEEIEKLEEN